MTPTRESPPAPAGPASAPGGSRAAEEELARVLEIVRGVALETGGPRALQAVGPEASLEREVGLGSLERVELQQRLETAFGRELGDQTLLLDSPRELARALREAPGAPTANPAVRIPALPAAPTSLAESAATVPEALRAWAIAQRDRPHVYLHGDSGASTVLTYGELWDGAARIAAGVGARGVARGETVALMLPTGTGFLRAFMGIQLAGAVPVPLYPPVRLDRLEEYFRRQARILGNAGARLLVTLPEAMPVARALRGTLSTGLVVVSEEELARGAEPAPEPSGSPGDAALIQYTSGSTGDPKGVLLSHAALLANVRAIAGGLEMRATDVGVSWLPLYHDMGLIGTWLNCLVHGIPLALMSPLAFLARPERWLWSIHQHRATLSPAPNFAYELCVRKIPDAALEGLDLSSWRGALNGSEAVSPDTLERFARRFGPYGFRPEALTPTYGLAESAVGLCLPPLGRGPRVDLVARTPFERERRARAAAPDEGSPLRFVSVGSPLPRHEVRVLDDEGEPLPERIVGRIVFRGPSTMTGYYHRPDATAAVTLPGGWIDTGDLGYRHDGELYVTGRKKDLIIKGGRNLVPEEVEAVAAAVEGVRKGCVAAFGVADSRTGTERLVIVAETRETAPDALRSLRGAVVARVGEAIDLPPDDVVLVPPGAVPKTSSGKLRRGAARDGYEAGRLGKRQRIPPRVALELLRSRVAGGARTARARARRLAYGAYLAVAGTGAFLLAGLPIWALVWVLPGRRPARVLERRAARLALWITGCRTTLEGGENLPSGAPLILAANHTSYADTVALVALLPLEFGIVAKRELLRWPAIGTLIRRAGHPTVDRWEFRRSLADAERITAALRAGEAILFFPEGTFVGAAGLRPFRLGAFETAVETGTPVVPIALRGTRHVLPAGHHLPRPGPIHIWIGPPVAPEGEGWPAVIALRDRVAEAIAAHCGEPRLEMVAGGPVRS